MHQLAAKIKDKKEQLDAWLHSLEQPKELPLYSSVDIRDAGFKTVVVDTNLFPAGFNNFCEHGQQDSVKFFKTAILSRVPSCSKILIVAEEHTRNTWYLENIRVLKQIIEQAGFHATVATFLYVQPEFCNEAQYVELETASGSSLRIHCFQRILREIKSGMKHFDLIILNNDLISGIPDTLRNIDIPMYPSLQAGWHSRYKSTHFKFTQELVIKMAGILDVDPWFFSCLDRVVENVNINEDADRQKLQDSTVQLFDQIRAKYKEHDIKEKPFVFIKADFGTYGMGVMPIEDPEEIATLNRKDRNRLYKGKGSQIINRYLLQEGVKTVHRVEGHTAEVCMYQIAENLAGAFYRFHAKKGDRDNLNSQGMEFLALCPHPHRYPRCCISYDTDTFELYRQLGRIASLAAQKEIAELELSPK